MRRFAQYLLCPQIVLFAATAASAITIPTVPVGNPGNANDPSTGNLYGGVSYDYRIGKYEVTNAQYTAFLNEKAKSDPLALYEVNMGGNVYGGITRSGVSGSYTYTLKPNMGDKPVNYVSWYDAIRFTNWLHNGQGAGDTETGAYTLLGGTTTPSNWQFITRNSDAVWWLPSENEWYKAAFFQPATQGGDVDNYWLYPTKSNSAPTPATANGVGDINNPGANVANYDYGADWNGQNGNVTTVGSAGLLSESFYGTADQGGNVWEWNDTRIAGSYRGERAGGFFNDALYLQSSFRNYDNTNGHYGLGFRVATVPEPSTFALAALGIVGLFVLRKRRRATCVGMLALTLISLAVADVRALTIPTVPVGNQGNAADPLTGNLYGGVSYDYRIGTNEVTVGQYTTFLNAVAATDTYALYNTSMATDLNIAGIARSGVSGSYTYSVIGSPNKPVTYVSWGDAARYSNWLHNGQPAGAQNTSTTENGSYTLNGATSNSALNAVTRNSGATWVIPSESEWYKAAYYEPGNNTFYQYPTSSNANPASTPPGNQPNSGNFYHGGTGYAATGSLTYSSSQNYLTDVGAYTASASPYGTFDQGGNVYEWNEALTIFSGRVIRGGGWGDSGGTLRSSFRFDSFNPTFENVDVGFRMATVPEPSSFALAARGIASLMVLRERRRPLLRDCLNT